MPVHPMRGSSTPNARGTGLPLVALRSLAMQASIACPGAHRALVRGIGICAVALLVCCSSASAQSQGGQYQAYSLRHKKAGDVEQRLLEMLRHLVQAR